MSFNWKRNDNNNWHNNNSNNNRGGHRFPNNRNNNYRKHNNSNAWPGGGGSGRGGYHNWNHGSRFGGPSLNPGFNFNNRPIGGGYFNQPPPHRQPMFHPQELLQGLQDHLQELQQQQNIYHLQQQHHQQQHNQQNCSRPPQPHQNNFYDIDASDDSQQSEDKQMQPDNGDESNRDKFRNPDPPDPGSTSTPKAGKRTNNVPDPVIETKSAEDVTKKVFQQLQQMKKHDLKQIISNPSSIVETALKTHAQKKAREEMRNALKKFSTETQSSDGAPTDSDTNFTLRPDDTIDSDKIPDSILDLFDVNLSNSEVSVSKVLDENLPKLPIESASQILNTDDLFSRAEALLMNDDALLDATESNIDSTVEPDTGDLELDINEQTVISGATCVKEEEQEKTPPIIYPPTKLQQTLDIPLPAVNTRKEPVIPVLEIPLQLGLYSEIVRNRTNIKKDPKPQSDKTKSAEKELKHPKRSEEKNKDNKRIESSKGENSKKIQNDKLQGKSKNGKTLNFPIEPPPKPKEPIDLMTKLMTMNAIRECYTKYSNARNSPQTCSASSQGKGEKRRDRDNDRDKQRRDKKRSRSRSRSRERRDKSDKHSRKHRSVDDERYLKVPVDESQSAPNEPAKVLATVIKQEPIDDDFVIATTELEEVAVPIKSTKKPSVEHTQVAEVANIPNEATLPEETIQPTQVEENLKDGEEEQTQNIDESKEPENIDQSKTEIETAENQLQKLIASIGRPNTVKEKAEEQTRRLEASPRAQSIQNEPTNAQLLTKEGFRFSIADAVETKIPEVVKLSGAIDVFDAAKEQIPEIVPSTNHAANDEPMDMEEQLSIEDKIIETRIEPMEVEQLAEQLLEPGVDEVDCERGLQMENGSEQVVEMLKTSSETKDSELNNEKSTISEISEMISPKVSENHEQKDDPHQKLATVPDSLVTEVSPANPSEVCESTVEAEQTISQPTEIVDELKQSEQNKTLGGEKKPKTTTTEDLKNKLQLVVEASKSSKFEARSTTKSKGKDEKQHKKKKNLHEVAEMEKSQLFSVDLPKSMKSTTGDKEKKVTKKSEERETEKEKHLETSTTKLPEKAIETEVHDLKSIDKEKEKLKEKDKEKLKEKEREKEKRDKDKREEKEKEKEREKEKDKDKREEKEKEREREKEKEKDKDRETKKGETKDSSDYKRKSEKRKEKGESHRRSEKSKKESTPTPNTQKHRDLEISVERKKTEPHKTLEKSQEKSQKPEKSTKASDKTISTLHKSRTEKKQQPSTPPPISSSPSPQRVIVVKEKEIQETQQLRLWRSPGEKKMCMTESSDDSIASSMVPSMKQVTVSLERTNLTLFDVHDDPQAVKAKRMKGIDLQLMDLHQQRMEIERQISKLQQDKMKIDERTMELQQERMALIDSLLVPSIPVIVQQPPAPTVAAPPAPAVAAPPAPAVAAPPAPAVAVPPSPPVVEIIEVPTVQPPIQRSQTPTNNKKQSDNELEIELSIIDARVGKKRKRRGRKHSPKAIAEKPTVVPEAVSLPVSELLKSIRQEDIMPNPVESQPTPQSVVVLDVTLPKVAPKNKRKATSVSTPYVRNKRQRLNTSISADSETSVAVVPTTGTPIAKTPPVATPPVVLSPVVAASSSAVTSPPVVVQKITKIKKSHLLTILEQEKRRLEENQQTVISPVKESRKINKGNSRNRRKIQCQLKSVGFRVIPLDSDEFRAIQSRPCQVLVGKYMPELVVDGNQSLHKNVEPVTVEKPVDVVSLSDYENSCDANEQQVQQDHIDLETDPTNLDSLMPTLELVDDELLSTTTLGLSYFQESERNDFDSLFNDVVALEPSNSQFKGHKAAIICLKIHNEFLIGGDEDGNMYRFQWATGQLQKTIKLHTGRINGFIVRNNRSIYSISNDTYLKKIDLEFFDRCLGGASLNEELVAMDCNWDRVYVGTKQGNVFIYDIEDASFNENAVCKLGEPIATLKTTTVQNQVSRDFLIISSQTSQITIRDAETGTLVYKVRGIANIYDSIIDEPYWDGFRASCQKSILYCRSSNNDIFAVDVMTGLESFRFKCKTRGNCMKIWKNFLMVGCDDGFVYVFNKFHGQEEARIETFSSESSPLSIDFVENKIVASSGDRVLKMFDIPEEIIRLVDAI